MNLSLKTRMAILIVIVVVMLGFAVSSGNAPAGEVLLKLLTSSFTNPVLATDTLKRFTPLAIAGVAVFWALRAGLFNIGVEGQLSIGALAAVAVGSKVPGPVGVVLAIACGTIAGALWALPAGWVKAYRGGHEVISTIMLNQIALLLVSFLVSGPLKDPNAGYPTSSTLAESSRVPNTGTMMPVTVSLSVIIALVLVVLFSRWLSRTVGGYELSLVGENPTAGKFAGIDSRKVILKAMISSGALAGLAGALQLLSYEFRMYEQFSSGYGFDALGVAILAGANPLMILGSAAAFAILGQGASMVQILGIPSGISNVLFALLIVIVAALRARNSRSADA